jgi:8-oxo-dGTP diphosphatase
VSKISNHKLAVAVMVVNHENKILLVNGYERGWEFPGGFVGKDESIKAAAIREVKEESGININNINLLGVEQSVSNSTIVFLLKATPVSGKLSISNETKDVGYFTVEESKRMIKLEAFKERMVRCLNKKEIPFLTEK